MLAFPLSLQVEGRIHCCIIKSGLGARLLHHSSEVLAFLHATKIGCSSLEHLPELNPCSWTRPIEPQRQFESLRHHPTDRRRFHLNQPNNKHITIRPHAVPLTTTIQDVCTSGLLRSPWPPCSLQPHAIHCHAHLYLDHFQAC